MKTKKRNVLLTLAMMMGLLIAMSTVAFADDDPIPFDDTQYLPTESGTYSLENDVDLREQYVVPAGENITIDLNGKEVIDSDGGDCMICIGDHDNTVATSLTIKDSAGEGKIFGEDRYNYMVWVTGKGTFTLESGTIQTDSGTLFRVQNDAKIVINSGKVSTSTESSVVDLYDNSSLTVNGGEVFGLIQLTDNPSVSVSGGLFEMRPNNEWIADGCTVIDDQGDDYYYYKVVKGVSSITLDEWEPYVAEGEDKTFHATVLPEDAYNKDVIWSSDNEAVATVTQEGVVSGKAFGDVTITAKPAGQPGKNANSDALTAAHTIHVLPDIWWKKADNTLYLRTGQEDGYTQYNPNNKWDSHDYSRVVVENTIRPVEMMNWFNDAKELEDIVNPGNIDTSRVTSLYGLFNGCNNLGFVDMSSWDTSSVTHMNYMFSFCNALTELDLTSFDVSSVYRMESMFEGCTALKTIYVSDGTDWKTQSRVVDSGTNMFNYCKKLTGEQGTTYAENRINADFARLDGGEDAPGYFTGIYKVTFEDGMGHVLTKVQLLKRGESATAPVDDPTREGYVFGGWDQDYSNVTSDLTITPKWKKIISIPTGKTVTYNGKEQTCVDAGTGFTLSGMATATNVGSYQATATLEEGYIWNDGTSEPKIISWTINKAISEVTAPTGKTLTYNGKSQTGVAADVGYTLTGTAKATNAGSYTSTATLNTSINYIYIWADGSTTAKTIKWKINKAAQSITKVTPASKTYKAVKKTKKLGKTYKFTLKAKGKGSGKVTFKKANKAGASKITVSKAGKVTIKKGLKKGTYKVKVKASKAANTNYTAAAKTVIVKIIVK